MKNKYISLYPAPKLGVRFSYLSITALATEYTVCKYIICLNLFDLANLSFYASAHSNNLP